MKTWVIRLIIFLIFQASVHVIGPIPEINTTDITYTQNDSSFILAR